MKKIILAIIIALVAVFIVLSFLGRDKGYTAEKLFYRAMTTYNKIRLNPDVAPPAMIASVEKDLDTVITKFPETDQAKAAQLALSEIYAADKKYDEAIKLLDDFLAKNEDNEALAGKAYLLKGTIYEKQNKWNEALEEFKILQEKYSKTPVGLQMPIYIAQHYAKENKPLEAEKAYNEAVAFYQNMEKENKGNMLGYAASNMLVQAYMGLKRYEEAGKTIEDIIIEYPSTMTMVQQLPYVELIYVKNLNNPEKAIGIFKYVKDKIGDEKLGKLLDAKIKEFEAMK